MVLHGIVLLASARGLYLARHLPTLCNFHSGILKVSLKLVVPRNNQKLLTRHVLDYTTSISTSSRQKLRKFRVRVCVLTGVCSAQEVLGTFNGR